MLSYDVESFHARYVCIRQVVNTGCEERSRLKIPSTNIQASEKFQVSRSKLLWTRRRAGWDLEACWRSWCFGRCAGWKSALRGKLWSLFWCSWP